MGGHCEDVETGPKVCLSKDKVHRSVLPSQYRQCEPYLHVCRKTNVWSLMHSPRQFGRTMYNSLSSN